MQQQSLKNPWIAGKGATDHNLLPEIKAYMAKARWVFMGPPARLKVSSWTML